MATLASILSVQILADTAQAEAGLQRVNQSIGQMGSNALGQASHFTRLGFLMTGMGIQAGFAARAMGAFIISGVKGLIDYESQARKTWTQVDAGVATLNQIKTVGIDVARSIPVPLQQVQEGLYDIFSSMDVNLQQAHTVVAAFAKGAVAGATDLQTAGRATIAIMNGFQIPAEQVTRVMDMQFQTVKLGVMEYDDLAKSIGRAIPSAVRAGATFADLGGMMAFMTRAGMSTAQAATSAGRAFDLLTNPKFRDRMQAFGVSIDDGTGKFRPMVDIVEDLRGKFQGLSEGQKTLKMLELGGTEAAAELKKMGIETKNADGSMRGLKDITKDVNDRFKDMTEIEVSEELKGLTAGAGGVIQAMRFLDLGIKDVNGNLRRFTESIANNEDAMQKAYEKMQSAKTAIQLLKNNWEILKMEIAGGVGPALHLLVGILQRVVDWVIDLDDEIKKNIGRAIAFTAALAAVASVVLSVLGAISMTTGALVLMGVRTAVATRIAFGFYGVLGLLPAIIFLIFQNWDKLNKLFTNVGPLNDITERFKKFAETVKKAWDDLTKLFREKGWQEGLKAIPKFLDDILEAFKKIDIPKIMKSWAEGFNNFVDAIDWGKIGAALGAGIGKIIGALTGFATEIADAILTLMGEIDWFNLGKKAAKFFIAFFFGLIAGVIDSGIFQQLGTMILNNLGPIIQTALVLALAPPGLVRFLLTALSKIPIVGTLVAWAVGGLRLAGLAIAGSVRVLFAPLTAAIGSAVSGLGATLYLKMLFLKDAIFNGLKTAFLGLGRMIAPLLAPIGTAILAGLKTAAGFALRGIAFLFTPLGAAAIGAILAAFLVWKNWDAIEKWNKEFSKKVEDAINRAIEDALDASDKWGEKVEEWLKKQFSNAGDSLSEFGDSIMTGLSTIGESISTWFNSLSIVQYVRDLWARGQEAWDQGVFTFIGFIMGLPAQLVGILQGVFISIGESIGAGLGNIWNAFVTWGSELGANISTSLSGAREAVVTWATDLWTTMSTAASNAVTAVSDWFSQLPGRISSFLSTTAANVSAKFNEMGATARQKTSDLVNGVITWISQLPGRVGSFLSTTASTLSARFAQMAATGRQKASELVNGVITWISQLPGRIGSAISNAASNAASGFNRMASEARTKAGQLVSGFMQSLGQLPSQISGMVGRLVSSIGSWGSSLISAARRIGSQIWSGFKSGLGFHSPSYLERAMDRINEQLILKMKKFGPRGAATMERATRQIAEAFQRVAEAKVRINSNGIIHEDDPRWNAQTMGNKTGTQFGKYYYQGQEVSRQDYIAKVPGYDPAQDKYHNGSIVIQNLNISSPTPEQQFLDFERKIAALEMRVGRR